MGYRVAIEVGRLQLGVGLEAGPGLLAQLYGNNAMTVGFFAAPRLALMVRLTKSLSLIASGDLTLTGFNYLGTFSWYAYPAVNAGLMAFW